MLRIFAYLHEFILVYSLFFFQIGFTLFIIIITYLLSNVIDVGRTYSLLIHKLFIIIVNFFCKRLISINELLNKKGKQLGRHYL